ncbi:MAG: hypothetical protein DCC55_17675 [Chloroflexi bacterium]|nr:MAG: hypothetical protein DCC55_17675 [Chloroflexota bacterium]
MATDQRLTREYSVREEARRDYRTGITSRAAIARHPIHPILVVFPIAFLLGALVTDIVYWQTTNVFWAEMSYWLLVGGVVTAVVAAVAGLVDFLSINRVRDHAAGWVHAGLNTAVLIIALLNMFWRQGNVEEPILPWGIALSALSAVLLGISGWYGGELVYRYKIGVFGDVREAEETPHR